MTGPASGRLHLRASCRDGQTVLTHVERTAPFHPGPLHRRGGAPEVILQGVAPGLFPGDRLETEIVLEAGASLTVSAQGATKLYPSRDGACAKSQTTLRVEAGGALWWLPGDLIPFADARYRSSTAAYLAAGAKLALLEIITPGRLAMGEQNAYDQLDLCLRVDVAGKPRLVERAVLEPRNRPHRLLGTFSCTGTLILIGYGKPILPDGASRDLWLGADGDAQRALVRGVGSSAAALRAALMGALQSTVAAGV